MANAKNYVGSWREFTFDNGWSIVNISMKLEDLQKLPVTKGYIRLTVAPKREEDQYGNTHMVYENDYVKKEDTKEDTEDKPF